VQRTILRDLRRFRTVLTGIEDDIETDDDDEDELSLDGESL
jgi:hypothetical protein